jgi:hypothetical protein
MRALIATLGLLVPLAACLPPASPTYAGTYRDPGTLRIRVVPHGFANVGFHINRPAHVAVFEIFLAHHHELSSVVAAHHDTLPVGHRLEQLGQTLANLVD